jgi:hypothetical protein
VTFAAGCCCAGKDGGSSSRRACSCSGKVFYLLACVLLCTAVSAAMWYVADFDAGTKELVQGVQGFTSLLTATAATVSGPLSLSASALNATAVSLVEAAAAAGLPAVQADAQSFADAASAALVASQTLGIFLSDTAGKINADFPLDAAAVAAAAGGTTHQIRLDLAQAGLSTGAWALLGGCMGWVLLNAVLLLSNKCAARLFKACSCLTLIVGTLLLALAGILYVPVLMGSDVCVGPSAAVSRVLNETSGPTAATAADTWAYYSACGADASLAPTGAFAQAASSTAQMASAAAFLDAVNATANSDPVLYAPILPLLSDASSQLAATNASLVAVVGAVGCAPVSALYGEVVDGLCTGAVLAIIRMFLALVAAAGAFLFVLVASACLIFHHPGDVPKAGANRYDDMYRSVAAGGSGKDYGSGGLPQSGRAARVDKAGGGAGKYGSGGKGKGKGGKSKGGSDWR